MNLRSHFSKLFLSTLAALSFSSNPAEGKVVFHDKMNNYPGSNWLPLGLPSDGSDTITPFPGGTNVFTTFSYPFVPVNELAIIVAHARTLNPTITYDGVPILQLSPDEEISAELKLAFKMKGVKNNPYGILPDQETIQLGCGGIILLSETGNTICMFASSNAVYANADSVGGVPQPNGTVSREFISFKKIADLKPGKKYTFKVSYNNRTGKAQWFLNGERKAKSHRPLAFPVFANYDVNPEGLPNKEAILSGSASYPQKVFENWSALIAIDNVNDWGLHPGELGLLDFGQNYLTPTQFLVPFADLSANPSAYFTWPKRSATLSLFDFKLEKSDSCE